MMEMWQDREQLSYQVEITCETSAAAHMYSLVCAFILIAYLLHTYTIMTGRYIVIFNLTLKKG